MRANVIKISRKEVGAFEQTFEYDITNKPLYTKRQMRIKNSIYICVARVCRICVDNLAERRKKSIVSFIPTRKLDNVLWPKRMESFTFWRHFYFIGRLRITFFLPFRQ